MTKFLIVSILISMSNATVANILHVTYTGHVVAGNDVTGVFGQTGSLIGLRYIANFTYDDNLGVRTTILPYLDSVIGGPFNGSSDPSRGASLKINGVTFKFSGSSLGLESSYPLGKAVSSYAADQSLSHPFDASYLGQSLATDYVPASLDTPFKAPGSAATGGFINGFQIAFGPQVFSSEYASGTLAPDHISVKVSQTIPEPAIWWQMILGFGLIGLVIRRLSWRQISAL